MVFAPFGGVLIACAARFATYGVFSADHVIVTTKTIFPFLTRYTPL
jgi:hypothetical protein